MDDTHTQPVNRRQAQLSRDTGEPPKGQPVTPGRHRVDRGRGHAPQEQGTRTRCRATETRVSWAHAGVNAWHPYRHCCGGMNVFITHSPALSRVPGTRPRGVCKSVSSRARWPRDPGSDTARGFLAPSRCADHPRSQSSFLGVPVLPRPRVWICGQGSPIPAGAMHGGHVTLPDPVPQFPLQV